MSYDHYRRAMLRRAVIASLTPAVNTFEVPVVPPDEWFASLHDMEPYDVIVEPDGHIHGFPAASWQDCHLSYTDQCVSPPRSNTNYTLFKVGQVTTASGAVIRTGPITLRGGHASSTASREQAQRYYDDTQSAVADVNIGDGAWGIWINGAIRPGTTPADVRAAMSSGFSGDWREWQGNLELIAFSAVNTPGFRRKAALTEEPMPIAASGSDSHFGPGRMVIDMPNSEEEAVTEDHDMVLASAAERVARSIGRSPAQIAERLHLRVHG